MKLALKILFHIFVLKTSLLFLFKNFFFIFSFLFFSQNLKLFFFLFFLEDTRGGHHSEPIEFSPHTNEQNSFQYLTYKKIIKFNRIRISLVILFALRLFLCYFTNVWEKKNREKMNIFFTWFYKKKRFFFTLRYKNFIS